MKTRIRTRDLTTATVLIVVILILSVYLSFTWNEVNGWVMGQRNEPPDLILIRFGCVRAIRFTFDPISGDPIPRSFEAGWNCPETDHPLDVSGH